MEMVKENLGRTANTHSRSPFREKNGEEELFEELLLLRIFQN
jgi:hypothetical protein